MQIILASAKIMNSKTAVSAPEKTVPVFSSEAERFALEMSSWDVETLELQQFYRLRESVEVSKFL